jgi:hypothetical protein
MRMADEGEVLDWTRLANDPEMLVAEVFKAGEAPEVAIEATYGWYGRSTRWRHRRQRAPSKLTALEGRRVKNDRRDCKVLGDLLRSGMAQSRPVGGVQQGEGTVVRRTAIRVCSLIPAHLGDQHIRRITRVGGP